MSTLWTTQLNYPGRCVGLEGQIVGPTLAGELLCITSTFYDAEHDRTEAYVRSATPVEVAEHRRSWGLA